MTRCLVLPHLTARALTGMGRAFRRAEDGSLAILAVILFALMAMLGGIAVDMMRHEQMRTALQQTIDRSVLAAAALSQERGPEAVVNDYFAKAGLSQYLESVEVRQGLNFRTVQATAGTTLSPFFMHMMGIDQLDVSAASTAEQRITNVEISMVLDVSGSMSSSNRLANLKVAARNFVWRVLRHDVERRISISIVPYNAQVNLGAPLRSKFNVTELHGTPNVDCIDLPASVYGTLSMSRTAPMPASPHADTSTATTLFNEYFPIEGHHIFGEGNRCPPRPANIVRPLGHSISTLQAQINALQAVGNTSINAGLRWGLTLLDPAMRSAVSELVDENVVNPSFRGRPFDWNDPDSMKVVILMTDGEHFASNLVRDGYRTGLSPIWYSAADNAFAIRHQTGRPSSAGNNQYWYPHRRDGRGEWRSDVMAGYTQQTWVQVWARARMSWVAWQLYGRALGTNDSTRNGAYLTQVSLFRERPHAGIMDNQLLQLCTLAKAQGVVIYGIAFEAPDVGKSVIRNCSSGADFYYEAVGSEIGLVFDSIASSISALRLTQ